MKKFLPIIICYVLFIFCFAASALDRVGLICYGDHKNGDIVFYFNNYKVFNLDTHEVEDEKIINDEFAYYRKPDDVGQYFYKEANTLYWEKNPWNNYFTYKLDLIKLELFQRYVRKKSIFNRLFSDFVKKSNYYTDINKYDCVFEKDWEKIKNFFKL